MFPFLLLLTDIGTFEPAKVAQWMVFIDFVIPGKENLKSEEHEIAYVSFNIFEILTIVSTL